MMRNTIQILLIALFGLTACQPSTPPTSEATAKTQTITKEAESAPALQIDLKSPDQAVKTWWAFIDLSEEASYEECKKSSRELNKSPLKYVPQIAQSDVMRTLAPEIPRCLKEAFSRDIQEVKTESETRAVVFAIVKNNTAIPMGAEPDQYDVRYRADGFRFKYVVEKTSAGWKVSQVFRFREYMKNDPWENIYKVEDKPHYPAFVHRH